MPNKFIWSLDQVRQQILGECWNYNTFGDPGQLWTWGYNALGELGDNTTICRSSPIQIAGTTWVDIASGGYHSLARKSDGTLWTWGNNGNGQLGDNTTIYKSSPIQIAGTTWVDIAGGSFHSLARKS